MLTSAYMKSTFAIVASFSIPHYHRLPIVITYTLLAMMHTPLILPRIGIHTFIYVELLVLLVVFLVWLSGMREVEGIDLPRNESESVLLNKFNTRLDSYLLILGTAILTYGFLQWFGCLGCAKLKGIDIPRNESEFY